MKVKDLILELQSMSPDESIATLMWTRPDIQDKAREILELDEDDPNPLSDEQADEILDLIDAKKDASLGISWDTLHDYVDDYLDNHPAAQSGVI